LFNTATQDGTRVRIGFGKDPGQAGKSQALHLVRALSGFTVMPAAESGDKLTRFGPFSSQCRAGNVKIRRARWNEDLFRALEGFPDLAHDDEVDACSGALEMLHPEINGWGFYELYRRQAERFQQKKSSWVRLQVPRGIGAVQTFSGRHLNVREDGTVDMSSDDAEYLIREGCTKFAEWESEDT
jgi:predicted phage terminase large subunit-like protein